MIVDYMLCKEGGTMTLLRIFAWTAICTLLYLPTAALAGDNLETFYEASNRMQTPRYDETVDYCMRLDSTSQYVKYTSFGVSPQGRDLPLLIVDKSGAFSPPTDDRIVLMVLACIHAGEPDGKDAGFLLIRDFFRDGELSNQFDNLVLLFIPVFNVDGHERFGPYNRINQNGPLEMGFRVTAQGYNLNRDFLKADSPEMRAWLNLFNQWLPDFLVDCHVTDGADYQYVVTYAIETHENLPAPLRSWINVNFVPAIDAAMVECGFPIVPYVMTRHYENITEGMFGLVWPPRYSTGYGAIQNRPALLIETHMLKDYHTRVDGTRAMIVELIGILSDQRSELKLAVRQTDMLVGESMAGDYYNLGYKRAQDTTQFIEFKGFDVSVDSSDISGADWIKWGGTPTEYRVPYLDSYYPVDSAMIPYAYLIPPEWSDEINLLEAHGIEVSRLVKEQTLQIESYRFSDLEWDNEPWESRHPLDFTMTSFRHSRTFLAGTAVIITDQRTNQVLAHLLEPKAPDSFIRWSFFNTIYDQKEYFEMYVMERIARDMVRENPDLQAIFQARLESDSAFAANPRERLNFFYERSSYADTMLSVYPVGKVHSRVDLNLQ